MEINYKPVSVLAAEYNKKMREAGHKSWKNPWYTAGAVVTPAINKDKKNEKAK